MITSNAQTRENEGKRKKREKRERKEKNEKEKIYQGYFTKDYAKAFSPLIIFVVIHDARVLL